MDNTESKGITLPYHFPPVDLLEKREEVADTVSEEELFSNKNKIVETLRNYGIAIEDIQVTIGPSVSLYEIVPAHGIPISKIKNLENDITMDLAALGIRIIAPMSGKATIGIELPNARPQIVSMRGLLESDKFKESSYELPIALGRTISNEDFVFDLTKLPHLLVAGATGQGKSVGLNAMITSLLYKKHPNQVKFVLVDTKLIEFTHYERIAHNYLAKVSDNEHAIITDMPKVIDTMKALCAEMEMRYNLLKEAQVSDIKAYNAKYVSQELPYIVVVIDEYADLQMCLGEEIEKLLVYLAQKAHTVGIHLIIATQRPSKNIITALIKANFPARIAYRVIQWADSRRILDEGGANQLIGKGDSLYTDGGELTRVQCAFIDTSEIEAITNFIAQQSQMNPQYILQDGKGINI